MLRNGRPAPIISGINTDFFNLLCRKNRMIKIALFKLLLRVVVALRFYRQVVSAKPTCYAVRGGTSRITY